MSNKAARNLFIFGSLFFFLIFLGLTIDTMGKLDGRAPEITEQIDAGKKVLHKYDLHRVSYDLREWLVFCARTDQDDREQAKRVPQTVPDGPEISKPQSSDAETWHQV